MIAYIFLVFFILLAALMLRGNTKNSKGFIFVAFLMLFCIMGLRDVNVIGIDSRSSYRVGFQTMETTDWGELTGKGEDNYNVGFSYLMKLGYEITNGDYQMFIVLLSAVMMISYARFVRKYSPSPLQSVLCFLGLIYFTFLFDALKQASAMTVLLFAFDAIIEKKPIKFVLLTLLAATLHFPALIFLPAYWIGRMRVGKNYIALLALLLVITFIFRDQILQLMLDAYGNDDIDASMNGVKFMRSKVIIMLFIVITAVILRPPTGEDPVYNALLMFAGIAIVFQTFCGYNNIFERLADYYFHTSIVFIPLIFEENSRDNHHAESSNANSIKTVAPIMFCVFAIWRFLTYVGNSAAFSPYKFFWQ